MRVFSYLAPGALVLGLIAAGCSDAPADAANSNAASTSSGSTSSGNQGGAGGATANADGDCMSDAEEIALGTDPNKVDSDGDGVSDCDEVACVSNPTDANESCYTCGWKHNDPGNLVSTGATEGSVIANVALVDQCNQPVPLWDMAGEYHILFMTAAW